MFFFVCYMHTDFLNKHCLNRNVLKSNIQFNICISRTQTYHKFSLSAHCQHSFLYSAKEHVLFLFSLDGTNFIFYILIDLLGFASFLVKILFLIVPVTPWNIIYLTWSVYFRDFRKSNVCKCNQWYYSLKGSDRQCIVVELRM